MFQKKIAIKPHKQCYISSKFDSTVHKIDSDAMFDLDFQPSFTK